MFNKKLKMSLSFTLTFIMIFSLINVVFIPFVSANDQVDDLMFYFYSEFKDDKATRIKILKILTGTEELEKPYELQEITDLNIAEITDTLYEELGDNDLSKEKIEKGLKELYRIQENSITMSNILLEKLEDGLQIHDDKYKEKFPNIKNEIENKVNNYLFFINLLSEAKDMYNEFKGKIDYNFLYKANNNQIKVYSDMENLISLGTTYLGGGFIVAYAELMFDLLDIINREEYKSERVYLMENLSDHSLIDPKDRNESEPSTPGNTGTGSRSPSSSDDNKEKDKEKDNEKDSEGNNGDTTKPDQELIIFTDIDDVPWARTYIEELVSKGVLKGVSEDKFEPNRNVTREEFTKMIIEAFNLKSDQATTSLEDVEEDAWYYEYIAAAEELGIVKGIGGNKFGIGDNISRQDMALIAYNAALKANVDIIKTKPAETFKDADEIADYAIVAINLMQEADIINGMGNGLFEPSANATRAQAAKIIYLLSIM